MMKFISLDIILGGGQGDRLFPLTMRRAKPGVPFGGKFRVADFVLSNHYNSGSRDMIVMVQYKPASLKRHIELAWRPIFEKEGKEVIRIVQPSHGQYKGTADAVYQNLALIESLKPELVSVFAGDHVYLMDTSQMKRFHLDSHADLTIAALPFSKKLAAGNLGVLVVNQKGDVVDFQEKIPNPPEIPGLPGYCWVSQGNYVFNRPVLTDMLEADAKKVCVPSVHKDLVLGDPDSYTSGDFGFNIIPMMLRQGKKIKMYNFKDNRPDMVPITGYWRDIGTLDQFVEANMDTTGSNPVLTLENPGWPLVTYDESHGKPTVGAELAVDSVLAKGVTNRGHIRRSVVSYGAVIGEGADIEYSILMGKNVIGKGVKVRNAVLDKGAGAFANIDMTPQEAASRGLIVSPNGMIFIPKDHNYR